VSSGLVVAVTASVREDAGVARVRLNAAYTSALENAGLIPLIIPPLRDTSAATAVLAHADGLVLTGGEDVDPSIYGRPAHEKLGPICHARDTTEIALVRAAHERRLPTLAICRGIQLVNVAFGGTLIQDISSECPDAIEHESNTSRSTRSHAVSIEDNSRLAKAVDATDINVNSFHHQAIRDVAPGITVTAHAPDGIIEGAEWTGDDWWMLAVQWHPEELDQTGEPWDRGLFRSFTRRLQSQSGE
jgi:putative glutamine amidotransferase